MTSFMEVSKAHPIAPTGIRTVTVADYAGRLLCWYDRARQRRQLKNLDARMLDDIGLTRAQATTEARKPGWRA